MSVAAKLRRGEGPVWGRLKRLAVGVLGAHVPVTGPTRPLFAGLYRLHVAAREGLIWGRRFFWNEPLFRSQCERVGAGLRMEELPYLVGRGRVVIGDRVRLSGKSSILFGPAGGEAPELVIGDGTFVGHGCGFSVSRSVRVGRNCLLAGGVRILDMDGHPLDAACRRAGDPTPPEGVAPVVIEDDVWLGAEAMVLKGVRVGARSVVAASAVVTRDVPPDVVVAGNPARVVRRLADAGAGDGPAAVGLEA